MLNEYFDLSLYMKNLDETNEIFNKQQMSRTRISYHRFDNYLLSSLYYFAAFQRYHIIYI